MKQLTLPVAIKPQPRLNDFVVGRNGLAWQSLQSLAQTGVCESRVLMLWGESGSGKTMLLQALRHAREVAGAKVGCLCAQNSLTLFNPEWEGVVLDGVDEYDDGQQALAFQWLIECLQPSDGRQRWVVAASASPPADWVLRADVRSRLASGLVFELQLLNDAERSAVLQTQARARGLTLPADVVSYMLHRFSRDMGSLIQLLDALDAYALQSKRAITLPLLRDMFESGSLFEEAP